MLGKPCALPKGFRGFGIFALCTLVPALRLQRIDAVLPCHEVGEAAAHGIAQLLQLMFHVQRDD